MRIALLLLIGILMGFHAKAQDAPHNQLYSNAAARNPAFTGILVNPQINIKYRSQWNDFKTYWIDYDQQITQKAGNIGAYYSADFDRFIRRDAGGIRYSKAFRMSKKTSVVPGVDIGLFRRKIVRKPCLSIDPVTGKCTGDSLLGLTSPTALNLSAGLLFYMGKFYAGLSILNLNEPNQSFSPNPINGGRPRHYVVECGGFIPLRKNDPKSLVIAPYFTVESQAMFIRYMPGIQVSKGFFTGGAAFVGTNPNTPSINFIVGTNIKRYRIGYSYEYYLESISYSIKTTHELSMRYIIGQPKEGTETGMPYYFRKLF